MVQKDNGVFACALSIDDGACSVAWTSPRRGKNTTGPSADEAEARLDRKGCGRVAPDSANRMRRIISGITPSKPAMLRK